MVYKDFIFENANDCDCEFKEFDVFLVLWPMS